MEWKWAAEREKALSSCLSTHPSLWRVIDARRFFRTRITITIIVIATMIATISTTATTPPMIAAVLSDWAAWVRDSVSSEVGLSVGDSVGPHSGSLKLEISTGWQVLSVKCLTLSMRILPPPAIHCSRYPISSELVACAVPWSLARNVTSLKSVKHRNSLSDKCWIVNPHWQRSSISCCNPSRMSSCLASGESDWEEKQYTNFTAYYYIVIPTIFNLLPTPDNWEYQSAVTGTVLL